MVHRKGNNCLKIVHEKDVALAGRSAQRGARATWCPAPTLVAHRLRISLQPSSAFPRGAFHERLDETRRILRIVEQLPEVSAVAAAHFANPLHRGDEFGALVGPDPVVDRHHGC